MSKATVSAFLNTDRRHVKVNVKKEEEDDDEKMTHQRIAIVNEQVKDTHVEVKDEEDTMETAASK